MTPASSTRADLTLVAISFIWGATFVIVKDALADVSTLLFLALRFSFAAALLFLVFRRHLRAPLDGRSWWGGALCGTFLFLGYAFQTAGLRYTSASRSAFITGLYIVLVPLLASALARRVPRWLEMLAVSAAMGGTALLTSTAAGFDLNTGDLMTLVCAFAFSAHIVAVAHWTHRINYEWLTVLQVGAVALWSLSTFGWLEVPEVRWTPRLFFALAATGALATALSFSLYTWAQRHTTATRAALIFALEPVFAGLVAWAWAGEAWTGRSLAGAALILTAILLVELKPARH
jgi:drug/metabolite transporter (DMT)-like permease